MSTRGTAVVTGASSGIGAATAVSLAEVGFAVVAAARRVDRLHDLAARHPGITPWPLDVTDDASVAALASHLDGADLTVLVANAGGAYDAAPVAQADLGSWQRAYDVNVLGSVRVVRALLPGLAASGRGLVVLMGSTAGHVVYEGGAATRLPSTRSPRSPGPFASNCAASRFASPRSPRGWSEPMSSR